MKCYATVIEILLCFLALTPPSSLRAAETLPVFVSILPQKYFVERIGGDLVEVSVMVEPGTEPHIYEPKPRQMVAISKARIYFAIGIDFEYVWLDKIAAMNRHMLIVHTDAGIEKIPMKAHHHHHSVSRNEEEEEKESPGEDHPRGHAPHQEAHRSKDIRHREGSDPHIWLSPPLVMHQARHILNGLISVDPANRSVYESNYRHFVAEVSDLDREIREMFSDKGEQVAFMVFHPAWGYFAKTYGLEQVPIEVQGKEPKPAEMKNLIRYATDRKIKVVFVQPQFSTKSAETIAKAIGGEIAYADDLAEDWAANLRNIAEKFRGALR